MLGSTTASHQDFVSIVMNQEKLRCNFCDIRFSSVSQLEYHYSHAQHRVNIVKRTQQLNAKSAKKFRQPPDGVYMGRYKLCRRFETRDYLLFMICLHSRKRIQVAASCICHKQTCRNLMKRMMKFVATC